jgi:hypothetical protein
MKNSNNTIVVGQQVEFNGCIFIATVLEIKGNTATLTYNNTVSDVVTFNKRISSLRPYQQKEIYYNEQEIADRNRVYTEGQVVFSVIGTNGQNGSHVYRNGNIEIK